MLLVARTKRSRTGSSPRPRIASEACSDAALLLADELIQGFRERRRFTGRQTHRALHLHKDHAVIARAAVRIVDLFAALAAQSHDPGVRGEVKKWVRDAPEENAHAVPSGYERFVTPTCCFRSTSG